jgi:O-antigen ligase
MNTLSITWEKLRTLIYLGVIGVILIVVGLLLAQSLLFSVLIGSVSFGLVFVFLWGGSLTRRRLVITLIAFSILLPGIPLPILMLRPEELITLVVLPVIIAHLRGRWNVIDICFMLMGFSTVLSMFWGSVMLEVPFAVRDVMELVKVVKYWVFFRIALYPWSLQDVRVITRWFLSSMSLATLIGLLQIRDVANLGMLTRLVYGYGSSHIDKRQPIGTMRNPNEFVLLVVTGLAFLAGLWLWRRHKMSTAILASLYIIVIIGIRSRSGLLAAGIVLLVTGVFQVMGLRQISLRRWLKWAFLSSVLIAALAIALAPRITEELNALEQMSALERLAYRDEGFVQAMLFRLRPSKISEDQDVRLRDWKENWEIFLDSPLFGWGPGKSTHETFTHNEYILYMRRYGIVGLLFYLLLYFQGLRIGYKLKHLYVISTPFWGWGISLIAVTLSYMAANMFTGSYYRLQLMSLFWLLFGIAYSGIYFRDNIAKTSRVLG